MLAIACMAGAALAFAHYGGPVSLTQRAWRNFKAPPARAANLNKRLFTSQVTVATSSGRSLWTAPETILVGSGAGSYERYFLRHQPAHLGRVRDAHSLYVETLAELGPFRARAACRRARHAACRCSEAASSDHCDCRRRLRRLPCHAATDWDWELPAVTLAAIVCAVAMLLGGRGARRPKNRLRLSEASRSSPWRAPALCGCRSAREQCARDEPVRPGGREDRRRRATGAACGVVGALVVRPVGQSGRCPGGGRHEGRGDRELSEGIVDRPERLEALVDLAIVATGAARRHAMAESLALSPRSGLRDRIKDVRLHLGRCGRSMDEPKPELDCVLSFL